MKIVEYVKEHPLMIAAGVLGVIILYVLYSSGSAAASGGGTQVVVGQQDPNQIAYAAETQRLSYNAAAQVNALNAQVAVAQIGANVAGAHDLVARDVSLAGIEASRDVELHGQTSQVQIAQYAADTNKYQLDVTRDLGIAQAMTYAHIADVNAATTLGIATTQTVAARDVALAQLNPELEKVRQKEMEVDRYYDYKSQKSGGGGILGGLLGGIASLF